MANGGTLQVDVEGLCRGFMKRIDELVTAEGGRLPHEGAKRRRRIM